MVDVYARMIDTARGFFAELAMNNSKDWYEPRKTFHKSEIVTPATLLGDEFGEELRRLTGHGMTPKVFRIHRDVRFSKDKTPYNTHLHLMWSAADAGPVWFFGAAPDYLVLGLGLMELKGASLDSYRAMIDRDGARVAAALETAATFGAEIGDWGPPPLKRVPAPFAQDHPQAELLKRKALAVSAPLAEDWREGLVRAMRLVASGMLPLWAALSEGMAERDAA